MKLASPFLAGPLIPTSGQLLSASLNGTPLLLAYWSSRATLLSPMPRLGTLRTRFSETSSVGLTTARK